MTFNSIEIIFLVGALVTLGSSVMVVASRNLFRAAIWLIGALFGVAILFVLLDAGFLAAAQVVVYIGAIATLIIFAVMLTRRMAQTSPEATTRDWPLALTGVLLLFVLLVAPLAPFYTGIIHRVEDPSWAAAQPLGGDTADSLETLGRVLVTAGAEGGGYAVPFELASLLLVGAMLGAIVIAREK
jgi:NADH-quinone oxidoreductase subunit J